MVSELFGRADEAGRARRRQQAGELAQRQAGMLAGRLIQPPGAAGRLRAAVEFRRQRGVRVEAVGIVAGCVEQVLPAELGAGECRKLRRPVTGLGLRAAQRDHQGGQDERQAGTTPGGRRLLAQLGPESDGFRQCRLRGEDQLRVAGGQADPGRGLPGLHQHRTTLRGTGKRQGALYVVVLPVEVRRVQLAAVAPHAAFPVTDQRVVRPAVPHPLDHVDELLGPGVAVSLPGMAVLAEVGGYQRGGGGHDVPGRPAAAHVVQRREAAREVPGLAVRGGPGPDQADPAGDPGQGGQHDHRVELSLRQVGHAVLGDGDVIGQEDRVKETALGELADLGVVPKPEDAAHVVAGQPPSRLMGAVWADEHVEVQRGRRRHGSVLPCRLRRAGANLGVVNGTCKAVEKANSDD
ncbi:MAG TPA: hypothetical protein VN714_30935 [Trebonia sp.]|nr:hypothetical protein [Trebonia sp.]